MAVEANPVSPDGSTRPSEVQESKQTETSHGGHHGFLALTVGAVGVVFGDIGTSPLYAMREALAHARNTGANEASILGVVSLVIWALTLIVTIKYVIFLMRADNKGEGG